MVVRYLIEAVDVHYVLAYFGTRYIYFSLKCFVGWGVCYSPITSEMSMEISIG